MKFLRKRFEENGYNLTGFRSFYHWICASVEDEDHIVTQNETKQMENNLFQFEKKNPSYYHLFLPKYVSCEGTHSPENCLNRELNRMKKEKKPPTPREVFTAAEMFNTYVYIIRFNHLVDRDIQSLRGYIFAPTSKTNDIKKLCLLMHERGDGSIEFARIYRRKNMTHLMPCPGVMVNMDHKHCFGLRFMNDFSVLFEQTVAYGQNSNVSDFFRRLSLEFYGTENHQDRIMNIISHFELKEDNLEVFCGYTGENIKEETSVREKRKILKNHVEQVQKRQKPIGKGEYFALSSVFNVDLIIDETGRDEWEIYMPVVFSFFDSFVSPILLTIQKGRSDSDCLYKPHVTVSSTCSCLQQKPKIHGCIGKVKSDIIGSFLTKTCCPPHKRKQNHTHLTDVPDIRINWPQRTQYTCPETTAIKLVINNLKREDRCLDQINGGEGSLAMALAKELYGDENRNLEGTTLHDVLGGDDMELDEKLKRVSDWLKTTVYIYVYREVDGANQLSNSQRCFWTSYEPDGEGRDCRFYISLFYNCKRDNGVFDRIIPDKGCNCQIPPPLSLLRNSQKMEAQYVPYVNQGDRHHPLYTFFTVKPEMKEFKTEIRNFPVCSKNSLIGIVMQREDMRNRTIDVVEMFNNSLLGCISKEIFGTEKNIDILKKEMCDELSDDVESYRPFFENMKTKFEELEGISAEELEGISNDETDRFLKFLKERIEDDLPCGDLLLWLASTFFQTTIYVLRLTDREPLTTSFWTEYKNVRTRREGQSQILPLRKCGENKNYYITLLETESEQFYRIVPKMAPCNCVLDSPVVPGCSSDTARYHSRLDRNLVQKIRTIDNLLDTTCIMVEKWLMSTQILQRNYEVRILEMEGRRKNVNIATITGASAGLIGTILGTIGTLLVPVTGGISVVLAIGGGVVAVSGGFVAGGAKITEKVLNSKKTDALKRYQNCSEERFMMLLTVFDQLKKEIVNLREISGTVQANQNIESGDFARVQSIPFFARATEGLLMIPLSVLVSTPGIKILGAIAGPASAIIDTTLLAISAHNMRKGNKTNVTENLRQTSAALYGSRRLVHYWAYGNQKSFHYE